MRVYSRGQGLLEIAILVVLLISAFTVMQVYVQRGVQGKLKAMTDRFVGDEQSESVDNESTSSGSTSIQSRVGLRMQPGGSVTKSINEHTFSSSVSNSLL